MKHLSHLVDRLISLLRDLRKWEERKLGKDDKDIVMYLSLMEKWYGSLVDNERKVREAYREAGGVLEGAGVHLPVATKQWYATLKERFPGPFSTVRDAEEKLERAVKTFGEYRKKCLHRFEALELDCRNIEELCSSIREVVDELERSRSRVRFTHIRTLVDQTLFIVKQMKSQMLTDRNILRKGELPEGAREVIEFVRMLADYQVPGDDKYVDLMRKAKEEAEELRQASHELRDLFSGTTFSIDGLRLRGADSYVVLDSSFFIHFKNIVNNKGLTERFVPPSGFERATWVYVPKVDEELRDRHSRRIMDRLKKDFGLREVGVHIDKGMTGRIIAAYRETDKYDDEVKKHGERGAVDEFMKDADFEIAAFAMKHSSVVLGDDADLRDLLGPIAGSEYINCRSMDVFESVSSRRG